MSAEGIVLIGGGDMAAEYAHLAVLWEREGVAVPKVVGFYDDADEHHSMMDLLGVPHLGPITDGTPTPNARGLLAVGHGRTRLSMIEAVARLSAGPIEPLIHPDTNHGLFTTFGPGSFMSRLCSVGFQCEIGPHVMIFGGSGVGHNSTIGEGTAVYSSVLISGHVTIGRGVTMGAGSGVIPGVTIGDRAIVGAGAVVTRDVPEGATVAGVPARIVRQD